MFKISEKHSVLTGAESIIHRLLAKTALGVKRIQTEASLLPLLTLFPDENEKKSAHCSKFPRTTKGFDS